MTHSLSSKNKPTEADMAYEVLKSQGNPMHYQDLIEEIFRRSGISQEAVRIAAVLTQINLDTRFAFYGRGEWGLRVWESSKTQRSSSPMTLIKTSSEEDDKTDLEELDEESMDEDISETDELLDEPDENSHGVKW